MILDFSTNTSAKGSRDGERTRGVWPIPRPSGWVSRSEPGRFNGDMHMGHAHNNTVDDVLSCIDDLCGRTAPIGMCPD